MAANKDGLIESSVQITLATVADASPRRARPADWGEPGDSRRVDQSVNILGL